MKLADESVRGAAGVLQQTLIADACEALADKRQDAMSSSITQMLDLMKEREKRDKRLP